MGKRGFSVLKMRKSNVIRPIDDDFDANDKSHFESPQKD